MTTRNQPDAPTMLGVLAHHLANNPDLPAWYRIAERPTGNGTNHGLQLHLWSNPDQGTADLAIWADTMPTGVESWAVRYSDTGVNGYILGVLAGHPVEVCAQIPSDAAPDGTRGTRLPWQVEKVVPLDEALAPYDAKRQARKAQA